MKSKAILACTALLVTGAVGTASHTAFAGCGVTIEVHNKTSSDITVQWADSDSRSKVLGVAGTWKKLDTGTTQVAPAAIRSRAILLDTSCSNQHQYRVEIKQNGNTWFKYYPSQSTWTTALKPHIDVT